MTRDQGIYRLEARFDLAASPTGAWRVLTDYARLPLLNPGIQEARVLASEGPLRHRLYTRERLCVLVFCRTLEHTQWMTESPPFHLSATVDPATGDFEHGTARWTLVAEGEGSRLDLYVEVRPRFWVPPAIGPWLIARALRREAVETAQGLDRLAAEDP